MGDPGSKCILTILTKCVEASTRQTILSSFDLSGHPFSSAGDDQIHVGSYETYQNMMNNTYLFGLKPSIEKFGCFTKAVNFCEQIIVRGSFENFYPDPERDDALLDTLKVRLLSSEMKGGG